MSVPGGAGNLDISGRKGGEVAFAVRTDGKLVDGDGGQYASGVGLTRKIGKDSDDGWRF